MLKVELKEILLTKDTQKKNPSQPKLTHQICYSGHETKITLEKANKKKNNPIQPILTYKTHDSNHETEITYEKQIKTIYEAQFSINPKLKDEIEKIIIKKVLKMTRVNLSNP
jgi:hypothetical protein